MEVAFKKRLEKALFNYLWLSANGGKGLSEESEYAGVSGYHSLSSGVFEKDAFLVVCQSAEVQEPREAKLYLASVEIMVITQAPTKDEDGAAYDFGPVHEARVQLLEHALENLETCVTWLNSASNTVAGVAIYTMEEAKSDHTATEGWGEHHETITLEIWGQACE